MKLLETEQIKTGKLSIERRQFLKKAGSLAVMGLFGTAFFTSCAEDEQVAPTSPSAGGVVVNGNTITIDLSIVTDLQNAGSWLLVSSAQLLVVNNGSITALTSVCTHSGCDNNWSLTDNNFVCNCHGSEFTTTGRVVSGPASSDLRQFQVSQDGNIVTITK